jgi:SAM-dependent methyltransferase
MHCPDFIRRFFVGEGLDIGGAPDPLALYRELFPGIAAVRTWDRDDGDAQFMEDVPDEAFDFVHSSHCLEHLHDPMEGLHNWLRIVRPNGHLIVTVPDEDLYEQGVFPSSFNQDHKWTFTVNKARSWSSCSLNLLDLLRDLGADADVVRLERLTSTYRFELPRYDQTLTPISESGIEFVIRKRTPVEVEGGGYLTTPRTEPAAELRRHLNQYRDDMETLKQSNGTKPPFCNESSVTSSGPKPQLAGVPSGIGRHLDNDTGSVDS